MMNRSSDVPVIRGIGLVTPLGITVEENWERLAAGECAKAEPVPGSPVHPGGRVPCYYPVGLKPFDALGRIARIRRSSAISYFSIVAGLEAMGIADPKAAALPPERAAKVAVIFAICSGGVHYTRRFYEKVVAEGAQAASPLLFPETVYNAPASHLSALLGIDGASYTVVGDATVGLAALGLARELLICQPELEECIVVGAEECDWILWEGYHSWRLLAREGPVELHGHPARGMILAEGGAAIRVGRSQGARGEIRLPSLATGSYNRQTDAAEALAGTMRALDLQGAGCVIGSANGTWLDRSERAAIDAMRAEGGGIAPEAACFYPKAALGDALGAGALGQVVLAAMALSRGTLPGMAAEGLAAGGVGAEGAKALVSVIGLNQQVGAAVLERNIQ